MHALTVTVRSTGHDCYNDWCVPELPLKLGETYVKADFTTPEQIPQGTPYMVYLNVYHDLFSIINDKFVPVYDWFKFKGHFETLNLRKKYFMMPDRVAMDSAAGLVTWVIEWNSESDTTNQIFFDRVIAGLQVKDGSQIVFLTASETRWGLSPEIQTITEQYGIRVYTSNVLHDFCSVRGDNYADFISFCERQEDIITSERVLDWKAICYNRQPRRHRIRILAHMSHKGYLDRTIYSLGGTPPRPMDYLPPFYEDDTGFEYIRNEVEWFRNCQPINTQFGEEVDLNVNQASTLCYTHAENSYVHIVTETVSFTHTFITEKSYKPFIYMQPFIQFGNVNNIQALRNMGYDVFDNHIDHSYDTELDEERRMLKFFAELDRLFSLSDRELVSIRKDILDGLKHNAWLVSQPQKQDPLWFMGL